MKTALLHLMKKTLLFLGIMTLSLAKGQEIVTEFSHSNGQYLTGVNLNFVETTDKCMVVESWLASEYAPGTVSPIGKMFYKFSADGIVRDSLLFEYDSVYDDHSVAEFFERDPEHHDHFVYANFLVIDDTLSLKSAILQSCFPITHTTYSLSQMVTLSLPTASKTTPMRHS